MKILLLLCFLGSAPAYAQSEAAEPFRGANIIAVHTDDEADIALQKMARLMVVEGYSLDKNDPALGYFTTTGKPVGQLTPATYIYRVVAIASTTGTLLRISGNYTIPLGLRSLTESMFWVRGNLPHAKQCFAAVDRVAKAYPGARIGYVLTP